MTKDVQSGRWRDWWGRCVLQPPRVENCLWSFFCNHVISQRECAWALGGAGGPCAPPLPSRAASALPTSHSCCTAPSHSLTETQRGHVAGSQSHSREFPEPGSQPGQVRFQSTCWSAPHAVVPWKYTRAAGTRCPVSSSQDVARGPSLCWKIGADVLSSQEQYDSVESETDSGFPARLCCYFRCDLRQTTYPL